MGKHHTGYYLLSKVMTATNKVLDMQSVMVDMIVKLALFIWPGLDNSVV
jgi:hypothetical protein